MGLIGKSLSMVLPSGRGNLIKQAAGMAVQGWQAGLVQFPPFSYERFAREGYGKNELVYACIEELCSSAGEPRLAAYREAEPDDEKIESHEGVDLFNHPNPFMNRYQFMSGIVLYRSLAGNVYIEKVRSAAGRIVELWLLRPDRMRVIPSATNYIAGYEYRIGTQTFALPREDIIHIRTNSPMDDFYGMPPLAAAMQRVEADNWMRQFIASFFVNAGVPAGLLTIAQTLDDEDREAIAGRFRSQFGGPNGWHSLLMLDNVDAKYQPLGQSTGPRGLAAPDLDEITEARIPMVFGVPLELIGARLGMIHGNRSTTKEARAGFWDETLAPLYTEIAEAITLGLAGEYAGDQIADYFAFDLTKVKALAEDQDAKHKRVREDMLAGMLSREEARESLGMDPEIPEDHTLMLSSGITPWPMDPDEHQPVDEAAAADAGADGDGGDDSPDFPELATGARSNGNAR